MTLHLPTKIFIFCASLISFATVKAADSAQNASAASTHASTAVALGITASGQAT
jgi:hypothetical protein